MTGHGVHNIISSYNYILDIDSLSVNSHLVQNRLKLDVTPIIDYVGYTHLLARATVAQWF